MAQLLIWFIIKHCHNSDCSQSTWHVPIIVNLIISTFEMSNVLKLWQKWMSAGKSYIPLYNIHWIAMFLDYTLSLLVGLSARAHILGDKQRVWSPICVREFKYVFLLWHLVWKFTSVMFQFLSCYIIVTALCHVYLIARLLWIWESHISHLTLWDIQDVSQMISQVCTIW